VAKRKKGYDGGLTKWFREDWRDLRTGKKCGRSGEEMTIRKYPVCRPKAVADRMTAKQKKNVISRKTGPGKVKYPITASGKTRKK
jgi:hypothetical protein